MSHDRYHDEHPHHMAMLPDGERIAILEANERNMRRDLTAIRAALAEMTVALAGVNKTLSEMSGGKKAVMGMFGLIGGFIGVLGTLFGLHLFGK